jgi:esterase/lipase superfamily enzyme/uncharacterized protein YjbI with pentapeptide repeats
LSEADLADLVRGPVDLRRANLRGAVLAGADLAGAQLSDVNLSGADLSEAILDGANLTNANLERVNLERALLREANLTRANLRGAVLTEADLYQASLQSADLQEATLAKASLEGSDLTEADLRDADLAEADLSSAKLRSADLRKAQMGGASLERANLRTANLEGANLEGARITEAAFECANLTGASLPDPGSLQDRGGVPSGKDGGAEIEPVPEGAVLDIVEVFFGTDRRCLIGPRDQPEFGGDRADWLTLGTVTVTIPKEHEKGSVERPWSFRLFGVSLDEEDPARHFTVHEIETMGQATFLQELRTAAEAKETDGHQLFVFIHGYNTNFDEAAFRAAQIFYDLNFDGAPVMYSWPSRGRFTSYEYDQNSASRSKRFLRQFLVMLVKQFHDTDIHLIAHSMGNGPLMEVLTDLREEFDKPFRQIVLAAPDIDRDLFISLAEQMQGVAAGVTLYASSSDWAIWASKFWAGGIPRAGDVPEEHPIVLPDVIETIDASAISTSILSLHHSGYAEASRLLNDIGLLWRPGAPPPERRPDLRPVPSREAPAYWRFPEESQ